MRARTLSPEHRAKIAASLRGRVIPPEVREHMSAAQRGKVLSPETRARVSAARRGMRFSDSHRAAISARMHGNTAVRDASVKGECAYCGEPATTMDHVTPRVHRSACPDGTCDRVPACFPCNRSKQDRTPDEWLAAGLYGSQGRGG